MAISASEAPMAGGAGNGKKPRFGIPEGMYDLVVVDLNADTKEIKGKVEPRYNFTYAIVSGDANAVPRYPFQQDPENPNHYGTRIYQNVSRKISNGANGSKTSALHDLIVKIDRTRGKLNGKPLTDDEVKAYTRDATKLNALIGQNFRAAIELVEGKNSEPDCPVQYNNVSTMMVWSGPAKPLEPITYVFPAEMVADTNPIHTYVDTGEVARGYYQFAGVDANGEFVWNYVSQEDAVKACVEKHGKLYSPAYQAQLNKEKASNA